MSLKFGSFLYLLGMLGILIMTGMLEIFFIVIFAIIEGTQLVMIMGSQKMANESEIRY